MEPFKVVVSHNSADAFNQSGDGFSGPIADCFAHYFKVIFGPAQVNWTYGGDKGYCDQSLCSTYFLQSVQSGEYDLAFLPLQLTVFNGLPENMSISPTVNDISGVFFNLYTEKSFRSAHPGILTSLKAFKTNLYILICIMAAVGLTIHHVRKNAKYFYENPTLRSEWLIKIINSRFGLYILTSIDVYIYSILILLSASFTTDYSITIMKPPVNTFEDLIQIDSKAAVSEFLYCLDLLDENLVAKHLIELKSESGENVFPAYISKNLNEERFFIFDSDKYALSEARMFCNAMVQTKKTNNFNIIFGNKRYYDTFESVVYNQFIEKWKRDYIIRRSYSCLEMGICMDAIDATLEKVYIRGFLKIVNSAQCIKFEKRQSKSDTFQSIELVNMYDLLNMFECLIGFCLLIFLIEICTFKQKQKLAFNSPVI